MNAPSTEVRQQAIRRLLIGIALILAAIVVLNALSRLKESQRRELLASTPAVASLAVEEPVASQPAPTASDEAASVASAPMPASGAPHAASETVAASVAPKPQPPVVINHAGLPPVTVESPPPTGKPQTPPVTVSRPPHLNAAPASPAPQAVTTQPVITAPSVSTPPVNKPAAPQPAAPLSPLPVKVTGSAEGQYQVQLGLFSHPDNATALLRRLQENGVSAHLESRVVLGPFKDKASAKAAVQQLRALGVQPIVVGGND